MSDLVGNPEDRFSDVAAHISVQSQNAAFGLPSTFSWLEKYKKMAVGSPLPPKKDMSNPFCPRCVWPSKTHAVRYRVARWNAVSGSGKIFLENCTCSYYGLLVHLLTWAVSWEKVFFCIWVVSIVSDQPLSFCCIDSTISLLSKHEISSL